MSKGKSGVEVPKLKGLSQSAAKERLEENNLKLGSVDADYSDDIDEGCVISQSLSAGSEVEEGTAVDITISKGPEPKEPEYVSIPLKIDYSKAENEVFNLTVTVTDSNGLRYIVNNQQRVKSDGSEEVVLTGVGTDATVRVLMDNSITAQYKANFETGDLH